VQGEFADTLFFVSLGPSSERSRAAYELLGALPNDVQNIDIEKLLTDIGQVAGAEIADQARELLLRV
jgi:hypothetical protein